MPKPRYGSGSSAANKGNGHVAVSVGNGQVIGTYGTARNLAPVQQYPISRITDAPYLGWAFPFGS